MKVLEGRLCIEVEGRERVIEPEDGEVCVPRWANHRLYPPPLRDEECTPTATATTKFLLYGEETQEVFRLDTMFLQNWYGYQDEVVMRGVKMDLVQVMCVSRMLEEPRFPALSSMRGRMPKVF